MADPTWTCPDCGAAAVIATDGRSFCQGTKIDESDVRAAEQAIRMAVSNGLPIQDLDKAFREISAQKVCGAVMFNDGGVWRRVVPGPGV